MTTVQLIPSSSTPPAPQMNNTLRPTFANSTFNIYTHFNPRDASVLSHPTFSPSTNLISYRSPDANMFNHSLNRQASFVQAYNRLIFQNPRIHNTQQLILPHHSQYPLSFNPQLQIPCNYLQVPQSNLFIESYKPFNDNIINHNRHSYTTRSLLRLPKNIKNDYQFNNRSSSEHWDNDSSISRPSVSSSPERNIVKAGVDYSHTIPKTEEKSSWRNDLPHNNSGTIDAKQHQETKSGDNKERKTPKNEPTNQTEKNQTAEDKSKTNEKSESTRRTKTRHDRTLDHNSMRTRKNRTLENNRTYRVHDRPLYERYQDALTESIKRGEYWKTKVKRNMRLSNNSQFCVIPQQPHFDYMGVPVQPEFARPSTYNTITVQPFHRPLQPVQHAFYNFESNPNYLHKHRRLSEASIHHYQYDNAAKQVLRLQRKLHDLKLEMKTIKRELSLVKQNEQNDEGLNTTTRSALDNSRNSNKNLFRKNQNCQSPKEKFASSSNADNNQSKRRSSYSRSQWGKCSDDLNYNFIKHNQSYQLSDRFKMRNKFLPSYRWATHAAPPPPPIINHPTEYIDYENRIQPYSAFCSLHHGTDPSDYNNSANSSDETSVCNEFLYKSHLNDRIIRDNVKSPTNEQITNRSEQIANQPAKDSANESLKKSESSGRNNQAVRM